MHSMEDISKALVQAERLAGAVKDPTLRPVAFGRAFDALLGEGIGGHDKIRPASTREVRESVAGKPSRAPPGGPKARIDSLITDGFFDSPKVSSQILEALAERGYHMKSSDLTWQLQQLLKDQRLRRKKNPAAKGSRVLWHYSKW